MHPYIPWSWWKKLRIHLCLLHVALKRILKRTLGVFLALRHRHRGLFLSIPQNDAMTIWQNTFYILLIF